MLQLGLENVRLEQCSNPMPPSTPSSPTPLNVASLLNFASMQLVHRSACYLLSRRRDVERSIVGGYCRIEIFRRVQSVIVLVP